MGVMAHPILFDGDDPALARVRSICLALPGAQERISHGRPWFCTRTGFAVYGGTLRGDVSTAFDTALLVKADPQERPALLADARFFEPAYLWPSGWVGMDLSPAGTDWAEAAELVETSYRLTAPRRLVRELDARR
jgi:hypothetical protein